jgi:hypothetical protein
LPEQEQVEYRLCQVYIKVDLPKPAQDHFLKSKGIFQNSNLTSLIDISGDIGSCTDKPWIPISLRQYFIFALSGVC